MIKFLVFLIFFFNVSKAVSFTPITTDARIKTIIYSPTEIFKLKFHHNFQSYIEFPTDEKFKIISIGDNYSFDLKQVENRLFIRPKLSGALTNMTIITDKRTYHFELYSSKEDINKTDAELVYVAKFYYPDAAYDFMQTVRLKKPLDNYITDQATAENKTATNAESFNAEPYSAVVIPPSENHHKQHMISNNENNANSYKLMRESADSHSFYNYAYSMTGSATEIMPIKIFDDGVNTYFEFRGNILPDIYVIDSADNVIPAQYEVVQNLVLVKQISDKFIVSDNFNKICIFNDNSSARVNNDSKMTIDDINLTDSFSYMK
ncbi:MAG: TrbG/VirB9 family P-type conjugative transfer protein [Rickettsiales bacterium]